MLCLKVKIANFSLSLEKKNHSILYNNNVRVRGVAYQAVFLGDFLKPEFPITEG